MKYCCLHQQIKRPNSTRQSSHFQDARRTGGDGCSINEEDTLKLKQSTENENNKLKLINRPNILERSFQFGNYRYYYYYIWPLLDKANFF